MALTFKPAVKHTAKARIALIGPSGSGKTMTALRIAQGFGGQLAVVDTEHGSCSKYADRFSFSVIEPDTFHPNVCIEAIHAAEAAGFDVLLIDSFSHFWMGKDGELELVDKAAKRSPSKNSFAAWHDVTPLHNKMIEAIIAAKLHIIVTMRSKTEWLVEFDERTKRNVPRKVGTSPIMKDGSEYEFDLVCYLDEDNTLSVRKSRCSELADYVEHRAGESLGKTIMGWLSNGAPVIESEHHTLIELFSLVKEKGYTEDDLRVELTERHYPSKFKDLEPAHIDNLYTYFSDAPHAPEDDVNDHTPPGDTSSAQSTLIEG